MSLYLFLLLGTHHNTIWESRQEPVQMNAVGRTNEQERRRDENNYAIVTLFLLQTDPGPPSEKGKVMWPSQDKVWGPLVLHVAVQTN